MQLAIAILSIGTAIAPAATTPLESRPALQLEPKAAVLLESTVHNAAPFVSPIGEPEVTIALRPRRDPRDDLTSSSCGERAVCYDPSSGRIEFTSARNFMPELPGLQRETISIKRDRIIFKYSF